MASDQMNDSDVMPPHNPMINNIGNIDLTAGAFMGNSAGNGTIDPNVLAVQRMHALEPLGWRGGDDFWDGPHDNFCIVCGSSKELFGCQTCDISYHADCMTPSLNPNEVPAFWFCPHCVERDLHIPPSLTEEPFFTPLSSSMPLYPSPRTLVTGPEISFSTPAISKTSKTPLDRLQEFSGASKRKDSVTDRSVGQQLTPPSHEISPKSKSTESNTRSNNGRTSRARHVSPPRKKSKYSAFSKEVDKALSIIYTELETAAGYGKSEGHLGSKIQSLEQQLKMQEGQMLLTSRELEFVRKELIKEREESAVLKADNFTIREENVTLKQELQRKENDLKEWRAKLRSMVGSEFE